MLNGSEAQYTNAQVSKFSLQAFGAAVVIALQDKFARHRKCFSSICMSRASQHMYYKLGSMCIIKGCAAYVYICTSCALFHETDFKWVVPNSAAE